MTLRTSDGDAVDRAAIDLARMRLEYSESTLLEEELAGDWPTQFGRWMADAVTARLDEPNAMVLATADGEGRPSARSVLLKGYDADGFVFFTNYDSDKGRQLAGNPHASLVFPWFALHRQVLVRGSVSRVTREETEEYFATRPHGSQLGAWASAQSRVIPGREQLERAWAAAEERFTGEVPAPPYWGGYRVAPTSVEFWQGRRSRLHDRLRFRLDDAGTWVVERLNP